MRPIGPSHRACHDRFRTNAALDEIGSARVLRSLVPVESGFGITADHPSPGPRGAIRRAVDVWNLCDADIGSQY
jgi:hypothetical protein